MTKDKFAKLTRAAQVRDAKFKQDIAKILDGTDESIAIMEALMSGKLTIKTDDQLANEFLRGK